MNKKTFNQMVRQINNLSSKESNCIFKHLNDIRCKCQDNTKPTQTESEEKQDEM